MDAVSFHVQIFSFTRDGYLRRETTCCEAVPVNATSGRVMLTECSQRSHMWAYEVSFFFANMLTHDCELFIGIGEDF